MRIAAIDQERAGSVIINAALAQSSMQVHLCNAYTLSLVERDARLRTALDEADLNLPDGAPVAWLLRGKGARGAVRGPSLMRDIVRRGAGLRISHFLWGGAPGVPDEVAAALTMLDERVVVAGAESPPYREISDEELHALAARVNAAQTGVLWIGIGTPRQDHFVHRIAPLVRCPVVPVGAAFDFLAGRVAEAPSVLQGTGLEWMHRLVHDPRRLWKRYVLGNPRFVRAVCVERWRRLSA